ncbi:peptidoglycan/LPS O-acetylase OafA/YrhL [Paraburkholderia sp. RAU6.4a]|uniref:acyltransferase family protein n=1 Tax=Paraburkholderia sp. RAU6.4a TaxID=2991067 RepID=UPI003D25FD3A
MTLDQILRRENNNADLLRLIAACAVIWGHAFVMVPGNKIIEPVQQLLGFDYSGSLAVKFFFFLSGILVTNSWLSNGSPLRFVTARIFRIFPALIVAALVCMFIIGPALTELPLASYFARTDYFLHIARYPYIEYYLPGVFEHNLHPQANGAIWTIRYELAMYTALLTLGLCGLLRFKWVATAFFSALILVSAIRPESIELFGLPNVNMAGHLPAFFLFGAILALHKKWVRLDGRLVAGLIPFACMFRHSAAFQFVFYPAFLISSIWLMTLRPVLQTRLPGDFSYGVYVFGWPIQQTLVTVFPHMGVAAHIVFAMSTSIAVASVSWYAVEKPCIAFGRNVSLLRKSGRPDGLPSHS